VFDLAGNVAEWTRSRYAAYPNDDRSGEFDERTAGQMVVRGGSFYDGASLLRRTARRVADGTRPYDFIGFRVVIRSSRTSAPAAAAE